MKKIIFFIIIIAIIALGFFAVSNVKQKSKNNSEKLTVVTTLFPLYDFVKAVGQDKVEVSLLLPPGVEAHSFEPKPSDIVKINESDLFVYTGKFMEPWAEDIIKGLVSKDVNVVDSSMGIELMKGAEEANEAEHAGEHAFEWAGSFTLAPGDYEWSFAKVDGKYADPAMKMVVLKTVSESADGIKEVRELAEKLLTQNVLKLTAGEMVKPSEVAYELTFDEKSDITKFKVSITEAGNYTFFTEHVPTEFEADEHFFKNVALADVEPRATEPESSEHHHHHGGLDPHIWLGLDNAQVMVENIASSLIVSDPANTDYYRKNADEYKARLLRLDEKYRTGLTQCKSRKIVYGGHYAFGYMANRYGLIYTAAQGFSPDSEPTANDLVSMVEQIKNNNIKYVFYEELASPKIAETLANETGAKLLLLNGAHNITKGDLEKNVSFLSIMEENLVNLKTGLDCSK